MRAPVEVEPVPAAEALIAAIVDANPEARVGMLERFAGQASLGELEQAARALQRFAGAAERNVYQRVRALLQAHAIYRYLLPRREELPRVGEIPRHGQELLLEPALRRGGGRVSGGGEARRDERFPVERAFRGVPRAGVPDAGGAGAAGGAVAARQPLDVPHRACPRPPVARPARADAGFAGGSVSHPGRANAGAHGPVAFGLERHLLPGHGLPRGGARPQRVGRPRDLRSRRRLPSADHLLSAGSARAGATPGERRSRRLGS